MATPARAEPIRLSLEVLPEFLEQAPQAKADAPKLGESRSPEWLRLRAFAEEAGSTIHLEGSSLPPTPLVPLAEATPPLPLIAPLLSPVRLLTDLIAAEANELLAKNVSFEVGDRVEQRYTPLHGLAGDITRGQYLRSDDVTGRQFNFDVRLVMTWRPNELIRVEAGYAVAYLSGEGHTDFGMNGPLGDRNSTYFIHGPCAALNLDF